MTTAKWKDNPDMFQVEQSETLTESSGKTPDILFTDSESPPLIIETSVSEADAEGDAIRRLETTTEYGGYDINTAIAVAFSENYLKMPQSMIVRSLIKGNNIRYAVFQSVSGLRLRFPKSGFIDGTVFDLANIIPSATIPKETIENVSNDIAIMVKQAANRLDVLGPGYRQKIASLVNQRTWLKASRTMMVLWLNAPSNTTTT